MVASLDVGEALLILKVLFLVLLYVFIWRIVRTASRDLRLPQESFVLMPGQAQAAGLVGRAPAFETGRLVVVASSSRDSGLVRVLDSAPVTLGRGAQNDLTLDSDDFASARHARIEPRRDGVWIGASAPSRPAACPGVSTKLSCGRRRSRLAVRTIRQMNR